MLTMRKIFTKRETRFSLALFHRNLSTVKNNALDRECREVEIPVPWGKLAAKRWGPLDVEPIIAVHGWQDNAGTFDPLIAELPKDTSIIAVDCHGHGRSSWLPKGVMYSNFMYFQVIHRVKQHYGLEKIGLIGHSMGAMLSFHYTSLFPQHVKFVVAFDHSKYPTYGRGKYLPIVLKDWQKLLELEKSKESAPRHSEQDAIKRFIKGTWNSVNEETCRTIFDRGTTKHEDGTVSFSRDPRIQFIRFDNGFSNEELKIMASYIRCPYVVIRGENLPFDGDREFSEDVLKMMETHSSDFRYHTVPGNHYFHVTNTRKLAGLINPFIQKYL